MGRSVLIVSQLWGLWAACSGPPGLEKGFFFREAGLGDIGREIWSDLFLPAESAA